MKKVGIVLSGLGYDTGTSVWDVSYVLKEAERCAAKPIFFAPRESIERRIPGVRRKNSPLRNFADEAKAMVRDDVLFIEQADPRELDFLLIPGGAGCINVLTSLERDGTEAQVLSELRELIAGMYAREKTIAAIGYGAALVAFILRTRTNIIVAAMDDAQIVEILKKIGADPVKIQSHEVVSDEENHILSTPGTSPRGSLFRAALGIEVLIAEMLQCTQNHDSRATKNKSTLKRRISNA